MRLINVHNLRFHEFFGSQLTSVQYAILSHTWGDEEVSYLEMRDADDRIRSRSGYAKIINAAKQAKQDNLDWVWVDTCCIDKSSSAELTEAINSMYKWYERSAVCYAYLEDVEAQPTVQQDSTQLTESKWFTRGWTLQELVAPNAVIFYSKSWDRIGEKIAGFSSNAIHTAYTEVWDRPGKKVLARASGIPYELLFGGRNKDSYSVAQRMSWASSRVCTRVEDTAYCLMGLFNINMPLLYGEEEHAFTRLQEEIIRTTDDHSIYTWTLPEDDEYPWSCSPVLATSPRLFAGCADIVTLGREKGEVSTMTKHGLRIESALEESDFPIKGHVVELTNTKCYRVVLNCKKGISEYPEPQYRIVLLLIEADSGPDDDSGKPTHFYRVATTVHIGKIMVNREGNTQGKEKQVHVRPIYITQRLPDADISVTRTHCVFQFSNLHSAFETPGQEGRGSYKQRIVNTGYVIECADRYTMARWSTIFNGLASEDFDYTGTPLESICFPGFNVTRPHVLVISRNTANRDIMFSEAPVDCFLLLFRALVPNKSNSAQPQLLARVSPVYEVSGEAYQSDLMLAAQKALSSEIDTDRTKSKLVSYETYDSVTLPRLEFPALVPGDSWNYLGHYPSETLEVTVGCKEIDVLPSQVARRFCFQFLFSIVPEEQKWHKPPVMSRKLTLGVIADGI